MGYDKKFTDALQFAWGPGFLSPGGAEEVRSLLRGQSLEGLHVLDIGSGLGGVDLLLASEHRAAHVTGIDIDPWLVERARALAADQDFGDRIIFLAVEPGPLPFPAGSFDVVFSKDAMIHIRDKPALYAEILRVLKPGGRFVASDWLFGEGAADAKSIRDWLGDNPLGFMFTTPAEAESALRAAGFAEPYVIDRRSVLQSLNRQERELFESPEMEKLAAIVGPELAADRMVSARGRQGALDSGDFIPSHLGGRKTATA